MISILPLPITGQTTESHQLQLQSILLLGTKVSGNEAKHQTGLFSFSYLLGGGAFVFGDGGDDATELRLELTAHLALQSRPQRRRLLTSSTHVRILQGEA